MYFLDLRFQTNMDQYAKLEVGEIVHKAKNLRLLIVPSSFLYAAEDFMDEDLQDGPEDYIESMARGHPRLKGVYCSDPVGYLGYRGWEILRDGEEVKAWGVR